MQNALILIKFSQIIAELSREARQRGTMGNKMIREDCPSNRPSAPQTYQCKITQSTGMATQIQFEVILVGNRIATAVL